MVDLVLVCLVTIALYTDLRTRRIPNVLTFGACIIGLLFLSANGQVVISLAGIVLGLALMLPGFIIGGVGGGDIKLMAAIGSLKGPSFVLNVFIVSTLCGGLISIILAIKEKRLGRLFKDTWIYVKSLGMSFITFSNMIHVTLPNAEKALIIPYGVAIFCGTLFVLMGMGWSFI